MFKRRRGPIKQKKILHLGIDFGTSSTVIAYESGERMFISSGVRFVNDDSLKGISKGDVLIGQDANKYAEASTLYYPIEKGLLRSANNPGTNPSEFQKTEASLRKLLEHLIGHATGWKPEEFIVRGVIAVPPPACQDNKDILYKISSAIFSSVMFIPAPFCVAYDLDLLSNSLIIDIGAGTIDLCRMRGTSPAEDDQITTLKAGDYIDNLFYDLVRKKYKDSGFSIEAARKLKEAHAFIVNPVERVMAEDGRGGEARFDVTEELGEACISVVPDIVEGIDRLVGTFNPEFQDELKKHVFLAGGGSRIIGLRKEIETYMKKTFGHGRVQCVAEPLYAGADGALKLCRETPDEYWDELQIREHLHLQPPPDEPYFI